MRKKRVAIFTLIFFILSLVPGFSITKVQAYTNSSYLSDFKIGLESMAASSLTGKTNGEYYLNGNIIIPSETVLNFTIINGKINVNGKEYESLTLKPKNYGSFFYLTGSSRTNRYMGTLEFKIDNNRVYAVNTLPIEDYLKGVVGYEMSESYPIEALKAQAVAARTYALKHKGALMKTKGFDFNDTITYQVYFGYNPAFKNVEKAVKETAGQVVVYNNTLIDALYSASHGGFTENAVNVWGNSVPYLISKPDVISGQVIDNEAWSLGAKYFSSTDIEANLKLRGYLASTDKFVKLDLNSLTRYTSGRVSNIDVIYTDINGVSKVKHINADKSRVFLPLQSSMWDLNFDGVTYKFTGKAYGHGLGMSQIGAKQRAILGQTYNQILKFYYDSTQLANLYIPPSLSSYTQSSSKGYIGQPVTFSANGKDGTGNYLYKYTVLKDGVSVLDTGYMNNSSYEYKPMQKGSYEFVVYLKDIQSSKTYDAAAKTSFIVYDKVSITSFTPNTSNTTIGQIINFTFQTKDGSSDLSYKYSVAKDGKLISETSYGSSKTYSYVPANAGSYEVYAYVKDNLDNSSSSTSTMITVNPAPPKIEIPPINITALPLSLGKSSKDVTELQKGLIKLGYKISSATGYFGTQTKAAVIAFQKNKGLKQTGIVDKTTLNAMNSSLIPKPPTSTPPSTPSVQGTVIKITTLPLSLGKSSKDVTELQKGLIKLGYKISSATGYFGTQTKAGVIAFQKSKKLKQTGIVDSATLNAMNASLKGK